MICPKCGVLVNENNPVCWNCNYNLINESGKNYNMINGKYSLKEINEQKRDSNLRQFEGASYIKTYVERNPIENKNIVTVGEWVVTFILLAIPIVNCIMTFVWAFSSSTPLSKKNFAKAFLIIWIIYFVLVILFWSAIIAMIMSMPTKRI